VGVQVPPLAPQNLKTI